MNANQKNEYREKLINELSKIYTSFFKELKIDQTTGELNSNPSIKYAAYPFIGSNFGKIKKVLIIGLDIGSDNKLGKILGFDEGMKLIEQKKLSEHNPHISGCYISALYLLMNDLNWKKNWSLITKTKTCHEALCKENILPEVNPLSYIAFTNYHKFVTQQRTKRTGGENRKYQNRKSEENLLINEIKTFKPEVVLFQSVQFFTKKHTSLLSSIKLTGAKVLVGPHPSYRGKGKRQPSFFVSQFRKM